MLNRNLFLNFSSQETFELMDNIKSFSLPRNRGENKAVITSHDDGGSGKDDQRIIE